VLTNKFFYDKIHNRIIIWCSFDVAMLSNQKKIEIISKIIKISNSTILIGRRSHFIVQYLAESFNVERAALFILDKEKNTLILKALNEDLSYLLGTYSLTKEDLILGPTVTQRKSKVYYYMDVKEQIRSCWDPFFKDYGTIAVIPLIDDTFLYGVLTLQSKKSREYSEDDLYLLTIISTEIAGTIRNALLYEKSKNRVGELTAIHEIAEAITATMEMDELLNLIVFNCVRVLEAHGCVLRLVDETNNSLDIAASYFSRYEFYNDDVKSFGEKIANQSLHSGQPVLIKNFPKEEYGAALMKSISSMICVPLIYKGKGIGTITLYNKENDALGRLCTFTGADQNLLVTLASQISNAIDNARVLEKAEELAREKDVMVRELSLLNEISNSILSTIDLNKLIHIILTAVTIGDGLGFNRAMLFLVNENTNTLQGIVGVGPDNPEDAGRIWNEFNYKKFNIKDLPINLGNIDPSESPSRINALAKSIRVPLEEAGGVLARTVLEDKVFNITPETCDIEHDQDFYDKIGTCYFATVPLKAKNKVVGAILVDNLYNQMPITDSDVRFLSMFTAAAGMAIENSRLYSNLEKTHIMLREAQDKLIQSEKLAALGEMAAGVAHEIKNPLVSIGGFARRLKKNIRKDSPNKMYTDIIEKEVVRLEKILNSILTFTKDEELRMTELELNDIVNESVSLFESEFIENNIALAQNLSPEVGGIIGDRQQLKQVFINLIQNSIDFMPKGGKLTINSSVIPDEEGGMVAVEIKDTGTGISSEVMPNMFNPFFTTKDSGTGLGLAISHKIISNHRGVIDVRNNPEGGASFTVKLPLERPHMQMQ
jgi:two-component system sensor histidine kinase HydH